MFHHVARGTDGLPLFLTWLEAHALWTRVVGVAPDLVALFLMPNHLHLLTRQPAGPRLARAARAYARWRNHHRDQNGAVFEVLPPPREASTPQKQWRDERYIHLQACRAGMATCPLAWPFSTHRDAVGLSVAPVRARAADAVRYHSRVSADGANNLRATELPLPRQGLLEGVVGVAMVGDAVSEACRIPKELMRQRGAARSLWLEASVVLTRATDEEIGHVLELSPRSVRRLRTQRPTPAVNVVARLVGDPRFPGLQPGVLRHSRGRSAGEWPFNRG